MNFKNELYIVQFLHPQKEHIPTKEEKTKNIKRWLETYNPKKRKLNSHERNFLKIKGKYIDNPYDKEIKEDEIVFWGEWEAEAEMIKEIKNPKKNFPRYIYKPFYTPKPEEKYSSLLNTDPFVFGNTFLYTICQQYRNTQTLLKKLEKGSLILFGSCIDNEFCIDTVFVVRDYIDHNKNDYCSKIREKLNKEDFEVYKDITLSPIYNGKKTKDREYRLYIGATFEEKFEGMFSFFPCKPFKECPEGFARPEIEIKDIITPTLTQGFKKTCKDSIEEIKEIWDKVVNQVIKKGLKLGICAELPQKRES